MSGRPAAIRRSLIVLLLAVAAILAVREQAVRAPAGHPLASAASSFPGHPAVIERDLAGAAIRVGMAGGALDPASVDAAQRLAEGRPLSPMPFLFAGARAEMAGQRAEAVGAYRAARQRNPRLPATRFLLANLYLRSAAVRPGLDEMLALSRIAPRSSTTVGSAVAAYARSDGAIATLKPVLDANPTLREQVLGELADDPSNGDLILALEPPGDVDVGPRPWERRLIDAMIRNHRIAEARQFWAQWSAFDPSAFVFNRDFGALDAAPPFNWEIMTTRGGMAEFGRDAGLTIVHYGREDTLFARQLLVLEPGTYRLTALARSDAALPPLVWAVRCGDNHLLAEIPHDRGGRSQGDVTVPATCPNQWIELHARARDTAMTSEGRVVQVALERIR